MILEMNFLTLLVSTLLPFLVALATKEVTDSTVKGIVLAVLAAVTAAAQAAITGSGVVDIDTAYLAVQVFLTSVVTYFGLTKNLVHSVAAKTDDKGVLIKAKPDAE